MRYSFENFKASVDQFDTRYGRDISLQNYFGFPLAPIIEAESRLLSEDAKSLAYFSMEFGLAPSIYNSFSLARQMNPVNQFFTHEVFSNNWLCDYLFKIHIDKMLDIPIYGGGLGVLAGDTIKSAADMKFSFVGVGILWNKGYFKQNFWYKHGQVPEELTWDPYSYPGLIPLRNTVTIETNQGPLVLRLWKYYVYNYDRAAVCPLILLDSNVEANPAAFRRLTDQLYRSDEVSWKIFQRVILGIGGMKALRELNYSIDLYHLNEGHAAFAFLEKYVGLADKKQMDLESKRFVFTCHTPVAAGHDRFSMNDVMKILRPEYIEAAHLFGKEGPHSDQINLTFMALNNSRKVNAVAQKHGEVMRIQFPDFVKKIDAITNGVHLHTWVSKSFQNLFDRYPNVFGDWRRHPENLGNIAQLAQDAGFRQALFAAHQENKGQLVQMLHKWGLRDDVLTVAWARRIAGYKRPSLIFHNARQLVRLARNFGPLQIILAGKAHPNDNIGAAHIDEILVHIDQLNEHKKVIKVLILENYDTYFGKLLTNCADVWLNNPLPPFEASGTSGMKAILNGVLQLSTLDGWVVEAEKDDIGWIFGYRHSGGEIGRENETKLKEDSHALYETLAEVMRLYYATNKSGQLNVESAWIDKMIHCVKRAAFFNTQRMIEEYNEQMWQLFPARAHETVS